MVVIRIVGNVVGELTRSENLARDFELHTIRGQQDVCFEGSLGYSVAALELRREIRKLDEPLAGM